MFRKLLLPLLLLITLFIAACGGEIETKANKNLVLYSQLDKKFTDELVAAFSKQHGKVHLTAVYELKADAPAPDLIMGSSGTLQAYKAEAQLQAVTLGTGDRLPAAFKDADEAWYGAFYDPAVFLINQQYARIIGQQKLRSWKDLENNIEIRIAVENLSNSDSTCNFLGAMASKMGEGTALNYLWNINRFVPQYAKFPFTPVRMAAVGDADIAITRQSFVSKYLENDFPAYVVYPEEGMPITLYGAGIHKDCREVAAAAAFIDWLIADDAVKSISQANDTGFMFLLPQGINGTVANAEQLWLNTEYLLPDRQEYLASRWLDTVRFSETK